jgi:hypothetical protein
MLNPRQILAFTPQQDVSSGSEADMKGVSCDVRFTPESGNVRRTRPCPLWAKSGHKGRVANQRDQSMF